MKYRTIGADPATAREVSVLSLGAMNFGTRTDEATSFAILDRFLEAGGNFIDTSDNYAFWVNGTQGGESEELLGRWTRLSPDGEIGAAAGDLLDYVRADPALTLVAYSPLIGGAYDRTDRPMWPEHDHPGTVARLAALREVAAETGATAGQVVLAWLMGAEVPAIPLVGASSVAQLNESLAAVDLALSADQRARLDAAN